MANGFYYVSDCYNVRLGILKVMKLYTVHTALNTIFHNISNSKNFVKVDSVLSIDVNILIAVEYFRKV